GPRARYEEMVALGILKHDEQQHRVASMLELLLENLKIHQKNMELYNIELQSWKRTRHELREQMLEEEAEAEEARKNVQAKRNWRESISKMFTRYGKTRTLRQVEPGAGKMVARIKREKNLDNLIGCRPLPPESPKGIYLHGNVGCGKTLLMDLLFNSSEGVVKYRRRMHFHAAMLEVHDRMQKIWKEWRSSEKPGDEEEEGELEPRTDSVSPIFDAIADELLKNANDEDEFEGASLLCFDEVQVVDPFTAVALAGIFGRLLNRGLVLVATSNRPFTDLNKDGLQKEVFLKFLERLEKHVCPVSVDNKVDYRRVIADSYNKQKHYFWPLNSQTDEKLRLEWKNAISSLEKNGLTVSSSRVPVMFGRALEIPESCDGVAKFTFEQLCDYPLGAADYMALAQRYHSVFITGIPVMSMKIRDKARRFITLVDELYNHQCQLICTAAAPPDELFLGTDEGPLIDLEGLQFETEAEGTRLRRNVLVSGNVAPVTDHSKVQLLLSGYEEMFAFRRAASRLIEMQTPAYTVKRSLMGLSQTSKGT
ncbi:hypothetical protein SELMODRAFT_129242, partial [Selaginella moellendorffii]